MKKVYLYLTNILSTEEISQRLLFKQRLTMFYAISIFSSIVCLVLLIQTIIVKHYTNIIMPMVIGMALLHFINLLLFERHKNLNVACKIVFWATPVFMHIVSLYSGGIKGPGFSAYLLYIISIYGLMGKKYGRLSFLISLLEVIYFFYLGDNVSAAPHSIELYGYFTSFMSIFLLTALISHSSERTRNNALRMSEKARIELEETAKEMSKLSLIASKSDNWVLISNHEGAIEWVNDAFTAISGYTPLEVIGLHLRDFADKITVNKEELIGIEETIKKLQPFTFETERFHKTGTKYWLRLNITPIFNNEGTLTKFISVGNDITMLKQSEESYKSLFDYNPLPILVTDIGGKLIISSNIAARRYFGYDKDDFDCISFFELFMSEEHSAIINMMSNGTERTEIFKVVTKDGSSYYSEIKMQEIIYSGSRRRMIMFNDVTEKIYAIDAVKEGEARLKSILANTKDLFWAYDVHGNLLNFNNQFKNAILNKFGIEIKNGMNLLCRFPEPYRSRALESFQKGLMGENYSYEISDFSNEQQVYLEIMVSPIIEEGGEVAGVSMVARDITENKISRTEIEQSEARYRKLIETMNEGLLYVNNDNIIQFANDRFFEMTGYIADELIGKPTVDILLDDANKAIVLHETKVRKEGVSDQYEIKMTTKSGTKIILLVNAVPIYNDDNTEVIGSLATLTDITQRKIDEQIARETQAKFGTLIEVMHEGLMYVDVNEVMQFANHRFCEITGYDLEDLQGKMNFNDMLTAESKEIVETKNELRRNGISDQYEIQLIRKDGSLIWVLINGSPLYDDAGTLMGSLGTFSDISERKKTEDKLISTNVELDHFAYVVSHDLKAPLRAINNLSEWIEDDIGESLNEDTRRNMTLLRGRVLRMENLINGILDYSRIARITEEAKETNTLSMVSEVVEMLCPPSNFKVDINRSLPKVYAEKTKLQQVFANLISNAIKYNNKETGLISIGYNEKQDYIEFFVKDNGPGIAPQYHDKIFVIFQTLQPKDKVESTGVGLSIVKKIIEDKGGKIWIESEPDNGATFLFTWPKYTAGGGRNQLIAAPIIL